MPVSVRAYQHSDLENCRDLWVQLTQHHRDLYQDPSIGGDAPQRDFDAYLEHPKLAALWVAEANRSVIGLCGLLVDGEESELEPLVVHPVYRRRGVGRRLVAQAVAESRRRALRYINVRPVARNRDAVWFFFDCGFRLLGRFELSQPLTEDAGKGFDESVELHQRQFRR